ncbi:MAG: sulfatase [Phycisphaeraceae bacterium]|nr:sulfatase [Phycisphaeraceae bacterium]
MRILYLDLDALTPSHLSCYGYHRRTSPTIDAIAARGVRCNNVYCSDAPCLPSRTAFYQGRFGIHTGVVGHGGSAADIRPQGPQRDFRGFTETHCFPFQLQQLGFHTAMVSPFGQRHAAHHFYAGFHEMHNTGRYGGESAEQVQPTVERWLRHNAQRDQWYLHVNFWDTHCPYRAPAEYGNPFEGQPLPDWITDDVLAQHIKTVGPHTGMDLNLFTDADVKNFPRQPLRIDSRDALRQWMDGYDTAIRYVDDQIARIVVLLKAAGVYEDTAIIISADHGENQGELGIYGEHGTADHATCHIPMIVRWPGGASGCVDDGLRYHLDWAPTCLDLLGGAERVQEEWDGQSYAVLIRQGSAPGREDLVISQCAHVCQRSVRFDRWLYIRTYHDGLRLFPREMIFDLVADPHEQHDLAGEHPELLREGAWRLSNWHDAQMARMLRHTTACSDPMWLVMREGGPFHARTGADDGSLHGAAGYDRYLQRLEQTGRAEGARLLRQRYPVVGSKGS